MKPSKNTSKNNLQNDKNFSGDLSHDYNEFKQILSNCSDIVFREFKINNLSDALIIYIDEFVNVEQIDMNILKPLLSYNFNNLDKSSINSNELNDFIRKQIVSIGDVNKINFFQDAVDNILTGNAILMVDGLKEAISLDVKKYEKRSVTEPVMEPVVRGPRDGFTEDIKTNLLLVRKRLKTPSLKMEKILVGRLSKTIIYVSYLDGIASDSLVEDIKYKLNKIDIDAILESGYIEELIEDNHFSIFSQFGYTERPDKLCSSLLEGHVGILIDNTPLALMAPQTLFETMQTSEDSYERYLPSIMIRFVRYIFLGLAFSLPSFYIALLTFHQGMIPKKLLFTIWASRENVPFPVLIEAIVMEIFFEGLREAGLRLPSGTGQTVSVVGALVIGDAAVKAGIVSSSMVIIVSITGIASFIIPRYNLSLSVRVLRFFMMILAGTFGLYGMFIGFLTVLIHMAKLNSFGIPYLSPLAPLDLSGLKDVVVRVPWPFMKKRPEYINKKNIRRKNNP
ncbi:spore germination protein [Clostridium sp. YIM B02551]|uniref:spore germination protein n=1 Tax=Clostridium sp. YIM B02551 TaxID=2910679 RepID=UPI001EEA36FA|nr:spore germination protein [Clostridium sp. YIM B02551]